jgi:hypothetical protein
MINVSSPVNTAYFIAGDNISTQKRERQRRRGKRRGLCGREE